MALSKKLLREYDRFGPWIEEIHSEEDIPDVFLPHFPHSDRTLIAFKVPHPIERRKAHPGDPLYDHVLALDDTSVRVLHREFKGITSHSVSYENVVGISTLNDLLQGQLSVYFDEGVVSIPFNTVSQKTIDRTVHILRERCGGAVLSNTHASSPSSIPSTDITDEMTPLYRNLYREEYRNGSIEAIAYQRDIALERNAPSLWEKLIDTIWRPQLRPVLIVLAESELILYRAAPQVVARPHGYYGYERIVIPAKRIKEVETGTHAGFRNVMDIVITVDHHIFRSSFGSEYPIEGVIQRLKTFIS